MLISRIHIKANDIGISVSFVTSLVCCSEVYFAKGPGAHLLHELFGILCKLLDPYIG